MQAAAEMETPKNNKKRSPDEHYMYLQPMDSKFHKKDTLGEDLDQQNSGPLPGISRKDWNELEVLASTILKEEENLEEQILQEFKNKVEQIYEVLCIQG